MNIPTLDPTYNNLLYELTGTELDTTAAYLGRTSMTSSCTLFAVCSMHLVYTTASAAQQLLYIIMIYQ